ncbi:hypothetical protein [Micromonospora okii]|uniref:hypothetical protein n=1 Tax=Micromonospora okii TaxID=1182970 RepID=UPI001E337F84|nr:hypothetical protein [Micromonospora okii]
MRTSDDLPALLRPSAWPTPGAEGYGAMRVLPGTGPAHEVIRVIGATVDPRAHRPVSDALAEAVACYRALPAQERTGVGYGGGPAASAAISALLRLTRDLEALGEDTGVRVPDDLRAYLEKPGRLRADLRAAIADFLVPHLDRDVRRLRSFSLILFRESDLDGEAARSLVEERAQWRAALTPQHGARRDLHLAVIPPPTAAREIEELARDIGCEGSLPCVVFLGTRPELAAERGSRLSRWSARRLVASPPTVPAQLAQIYRSVYSARPDLTDNLAVATGDKVVQLVSSRLDWLAVATLAAGAIGGPAAADGIGVIFELIRR